MELAIGIDLGTSYSSVAVVRDGKPEVLADSAGKYTQPSVVAFTKSGERLVGQPRFAPNTRYISSAVFSRNVETLSEYLMAARKD